MRKIIAILILTLVTGWFISRVLYPAGQPLTHGFAAYYTAGRLLQKNQTSAAVYDPAYFRPLTEADTHYRASDIYNANPPTTSLMLWPLSFLPVETARFIWTLLNALMLWGGVALLIWAFVRAPSPAQVATLFSLAMLFQPAIDNIRWGQAYLLIFLLLAIVTVSWQNQRDRWGAFALASTLVLKPAGFMLIPLFLWQRRWRFVIWTIIVAGIIWLITLPFFPIAMWRRYLELLQQVTASPESCATAYQTTRSLLCRLFIFNDAWSPSPVANLPRLARTLFAGLAVSTLVAAFLQNKYNQTAALMSLMAWSLIFAPLGEQYHHAVMLIPVIWLVITWQQKRLPNRFGQICLAAAIILYLLPVEVGRAQFEGWQVIFAYPRLYAAWFTLLAIYTTTGSKQQ